MDLSKAYSKQPLPYAFERARRFIETVKEQGDPPTTKEIRQIYRMAAAPGGNIFYRCQF